MRPVDCFLLLKIFKRGEHSPIPHLGKRGSIQILPFHRVLVRILRETEQTISVYLSISQSIYLSTERFIIRNLFLTLCRLRVPKISS